MKRRGEKVLRPVMPNAGIAADYRRRIDRLIAEMQRSYVHFLTREYRANEDRIEIATDEQRKSWAQWVEPLDTRPLFRCDPTGLPDPLMALDTTPLPPGRWVLAMDASPARALEAELKKLGTRWQRRFNEAAPKLARWFATSASVRSRRTLMKILKEAGIAVDFTMTRGMKDVLQATVAENVSLIRSIASKYHTEVEGMVMRSVTAGRDAGSLAADLEKRFAITRRRAALIARDQNAKATATFTRVRQHEVGIERAIWLHSAGGHEPRPTHVANSGKPYKITEGWFDPAVGRYIWPGTEINCRCVSKPIVKGFS